MLDNTQSEKKQFIKKYQKSVVENNEKNRKKEIEIKSLNLFSYVFESSTDLCHNLLCFEVLLVHCTRWTSTYTSTTSFT